MGPDRRRPPGRTGAGLALASATLIAGLGLTACTSGGSTGPSASNGVTTGAPSTTLPDAPPIASGQPAPTSSGHRRRSPQPTSDPAPLTTEPTRAVHTLAPVPLHSQAAFGTGVSARVTAITHGVDRDQGPGAATGRPTVEFHLRLTNASSKAVALSAVEVTAAYGSSSTPAIVAASGTSAFSGHVAAGRSADAVYAFAVPQASQTRVDLSVSYRAGVPTVLLTGSAR